MKSVVLRDQRPTSQNLYSTSTIGILKMFGQVLDKLIDNLIWMEGPMCIFIHALSVSLLDTLHCILSRLVYTYGLSYPFFLCAFILFSDLRTDPIMFQLWSSQPTRSRKPSVRTHIHSILIHRVPPHSRINPIKNPCTPRRCDAHTLSRS